MINGLKQFVVITKKNQAKDKNNYLQLQIV